MGMSVDAYMFYGIEAEEEMSIDDQRELLVSLGLCDEDIPMDEWWDFDSYFPEGIKGDCHLSTAHSIPFICIENTFKVAAFGEAHKFDELPELDPDEVKILHEYAEKLGWDPPSWMIVSMWWK